MPEFDQTLASKVPTFTLKGGVKVPAIAFGTGTRWYKADVNAPIDKGLISSIEDAIKVGYRHIDAAEMYNTEPEIKAAIQGSGIDRKELFITDKILPHIANPEKALNDSLKKLGVDYLDLYLIHAPFLPEGVSLEESWKKLNEFKKQGKVRSIGVSNFNVDYLEKLVKLAKNSGGSIEIPAVNQIEYSLYLQSTAISEYSHANGILLEAYASLTPITHIKNGPADSIIEKLSKKYNKDPAQILLRWVHETGVIPVTTSHNPDHQNEFLDIFDFKLTSDEVKSLTDVGKRLVVRRYWATDF